MSRLLLFWLPPLALAAAVQFFPTLNPTAPNPMARTYRTETPTRTDRPARAELLQRIQQREQQWQDRAEILPILRR